MKHLAPILLAVFFFALFVVTMTGLHSCSNSNASMKPVEKPGPVNVATAAQLADIGFTRSITVSTAKANAEKLKYQKLGFTYLAQEEVDNFMDENHFVMGPARAYTGKIPEEAAGALLKVYNTLQGIVKDDITYIAPDNRQWTKSQINEMREEDRQYVLRGSTLYSQVFVVGPVDKFDITELRLDGRNLVTKFTDPVALVKTVHGYIELARW